MPLYIKIPSEHEMRRIVDGFETKWGFPKCLGAIDGSHIPISAPTNSHTDYYNRKGWHSMIAVVDHEYLFWDICMGWPESVQPAYLRILFGILSKCFHKPSLNRVC